MAKSVNNFSRDPSNGSFLGIPPPSLFDPPPSLFDSSKKEPLVPSNDKPSSALTFPSYNPDLPPRIKLLCDTISKFSVQELESALTSIGIRPVPDEVKVVLKHSYGSPAQVVKFFQWVSLQDNQTPDAWNLLVDILGKNKLFEAMWDTVRSMRQEDLLSLQTFTSIFNSYAIDGQVKEAVMAFDVIGRYGLPKDILAVNSLLRALCEHNQIARARKFFDNVKSKIPPDSETFAILLEGREKEGNAAIAKLIFGEMIISVGWIPANTAAYDSFLNTLIKGSEVEDALKFLKVMLTKNCLPGMKFFSNAIDVLAKKNNYSEASLIWGILVSNGLLPTFSMYKSMIGLLCTNNHIVPAFNLLDEMIFSGAFPDSETYNSIFICLIKNKKVPEATLFFHEMKKNEFYPTHSNCASAIKMFFDGYDPVTAMEIWQCMIENKISPMEESANFLLTGLCDLDRLLEVRRHVEDMMGRGVTIYPSTMAKVRNAFVKAGRQDAFENIGCRMMIN